MEAMKIKYLAISAVIIAVISMAVFVASNGIVTLRNVTGAELESVRIYEHYPNEGSRIPPYRETTIREGEWFEDYRDFFDNRWISMYEAKQPEASFGSDPDDNIPPRIYFELAPNEAEIAFVWLELCGDNTAYYFVSYEPWVTDVPRAKWYKVNLPDFHLFDAEAIKAFVDESGLAVTPY